MHAWSQHLQGYPRWACWGEPAACRQALWRQNWGRVSLETLLPQSLPRWLATWGFPSHLAASCWKAQGLGEELPPSTFGQLPWQPQARYFISVIAWEWSSHISCFPMLWTHYFILLPPTPPSPCWSCKNKFFIFEVLLFVWCGDKFALRCLKYETFYASAQQSETETDPEREGAGRREGQWRQSRSRPRKCASPAPSSRASPSPVPGSPGCCWRHGGHQGHTNTWPSELHVTARATCLSLLHPHRSTALTWKNDKPLLPQKEKRETKSRRRRKKDHGM